MTTSTPIAVVREVLADSNIEVLDEISERSFPGENWLIVHVPEGSLIAAQSMAGSIEAQLNAGVDPEAASFVVMFRGKAPSVAPEQVPSSGGRLAGPKVDQLIQLLEARSRTSDALPSLKYMEDPRASLAAIGASRHHLIYGRRGVGKTALLLEAKRLAEGSGQLSVWLNAHILRKLSAEEAFSVIAEAVLSTLVRQGGSSGSAAFERLERAKGELAGLRGTRSLDDEAVGRQVPDLNSALRAVLRDGLLRLFVYIDDFYLIPVERQPFVLDYVAGMFRDCDGWIKVTSIERLTRPFEPSSRHGLEIPHDASTIDLDVTLEDPSAAQRFLESVIENYTTTAGLSSAGSIAKREALGRLVLASGGVPRDYLNLFAASIVVAREARALAREVGKEDVAVAAGRSARGKKRDLELDVTSEYAGVLLHFLAALASRVKAQGFTFFRVDLAEKGGPSYDLLAQLVDLRFIHLVQSSLSDQHKGGTRYEAYMLDLSEFTDVRLKRGLHVLDLDHGSWTLRLTGQARTMRTLTGTQLRDMLRQSPLVTVSEVAAAVDLDLK